MYFINVWPILRCNYTHLYARALESTPTHLQGCILDMQQQQTTHMTHAHTHMHTHTIAITQSWKCTDACLCIPGVGGGDGRTGGPPCSPGPRCCVESLYRQADSSVLLLFLFLLLLLLIGHMWPLGVSRTHLARLSCQALA